MCVSVHVCACPCACVCEVNTEKGHRSGLHVLSQQMWGFTWIWGRRDMYYFLIKIEKSRNRLAGSAQSPPANEPCGLSSETLCHALSYTPPRFPPPWTLLEPEVPCARGGTPWAEGLCRSCLHNWGPVSSVHITAVCFWAQCMKLTIQISGLITNKGSFVNHT